MIEWPFATQVVYRVAIQGMHPEVAQDIPEALTMLLLGCLKPEPQDRPNITEVIVKLEAVIEEEEDRLRHAQEMANDVALSATKSMLPPVQITRQTSLQVQLPPRAASEKALKRPPSATSTRLVDGISNFARVASEQRPNSCLHATSEIACPF